MNRGLRILPYVSIVLLQCSGTAGGQTPADSVRMTFRAQQPASPTVYVPGGFNNWGNNVGGNIPPGDPSTMTYSGSLGAWIKTYTFKIKDPADSRRNLGDSVWQYKFNRGGTLNGWYPDPLNPETNPSDNSNSVLRLTKLFWFEYTGTEVGGQITRLTVGLVHANSDTIVAVRFSTGPSRVGSLTTQDITTSYDEGTRVLDYVLSAPIARTDFVRLVAVTNRGDSVVSERGGVLAPVRPLPPYARHGVTLPSPASGDSVTFRLRVPGKDLVQLRVAPAGENPSFAAAVLMSKSPTSDDWWVNMKLSAGTTYEYLYELENGKTISDPWGRISGTYGSRFSTGAEGLAADNYAWRSTSWQRPPLNRLVIYELHLAEFAGGYFGLPASQVTFAHLARMMSYFDTLGVNAIELMPINDFGAVGRSGFSWGYDLNHYFALEPSYGGPADFKALVDSAHTHGIAVIADVVFNHQNDTGPLWQMLPDEAANPYFKSTNDIRPNEDQLFFFKDMDHFTAETQELVYTSLKMWIDEYRVDGFRYDFTQGIGWTLGAQAFGILGWAYRIDQDYGGTIYQIAEHLPESPALIYYSGLTSGWHDSFHDRVFDEARFRNVPLGDISDLVIGLGAFPGNDTPTTPARYAGRTEPVNMTINHDEQSLIFEMTTYQGVPLDEALQRDKLYGTLMFTSLGVPMLWESMEFSAPRGWLNGGERMSYRPVDWSLYRTPRGQEHFRYYRALIRQRLLNPALFEGALFNLAEYPAQKTLVWGFRGSSAPGGLIVAANFTGTAQTIRDVPWLDQGTWYDVFTGAGFAVSTTKIDSLTVPAFSALVYTTVRDTLAVSVPSKEPQIPSEFGLEQNFPNPFNPSTVIRGRWPVASDVKLVVYDMLGREVAVLANGPYPAGRHEFTFDAAGLASGVYYCRLSAGSSVTSRKMILLR